MTVPANYSNFHIPVKYFLTSYRALSDGKTGVRHLEEHLQSATFLFSEWKVIWIGTCALLRTSIVLFEADAKSCINQRIREEIGAEWSAIKHNKEDHAIFWEFLRKERNNILHQYEWPAYDALMNQDGVIQPNDLSLLSIKPENSNFVLVMRDGPYKDRNSLDLLKESAEWVEARIFDAIHRAGFDPDENRNLVSFQKPPAVEKKGLLDT